MVPSCLRVSKVKWERLICGCMVNAALAGSIIYLALTSKKVTIDIKNDTVTFEQSLRKEIKKNDKKYADLEEKKKLLGKKQYHLMDESLSMHGKESVEDIDIQMKALKERNQELEKLESKINETKAEINASNISAQ